MNRNSKRRLYESIMKDVARVVKHRLNENDSADEFEYIEPQDLGRGRHRQTIVYNGREVGYLIMKEKNFLTPIEEIYMIPDVEFGLDIPEERGGLLPDKDGWIDFKRFTDYDEAFAYVKQNFDEVVDLFERGDYD